MHLTIVSNFFIFNYFLLLTQADAQTGSTSVNSNFPKEINPEDSNFFLDQRIDSLAELETETASETQDPLPNLDSALDLEAKRELAESDNLNEALLHLQESYNGHVAAHESSHVAGLADSDGLSNLIPISSEIEPELKTETITPSEEIGNMQELQLEADKRSSQRPRGKQRKFEKFDQILADESIKPDTMDNSSNASLENPYDQSLQTMKNDYEIGQEGQSQTDGDPIDPFLLQGQDEDDIGPDLPPELTDEHGLLDPMQAVELNPSKPEEMSNENKVDPLDIAKEFFDQDEAASPNIHDSIYEDPDSGESDVDGQGQNPQNDTKFENLGHGFSEHQKLIKKSESDSSFELDEEHNKQEQGQDPFGQQEQALNDSENEDNDYDHEPEVEHEVEPIQALETGQDAAKAEQKSSNKIFFILSILGLSIMVIHALIKFHLHYFPESLVVMMLGMLIGALLNNTRDDDWLEAEFLHPETFFLLLLPPIILEAGYNLNKVTFFSNIGTIMVYAVFGTIISSFVVGVGIYLIALGASNYTLTVMEAAAYGSLISAVDPVATIAIFSAMNIDPTLNMLVFGESILNDAVSIVLTNMFQNASQWENSDESIIMKCVYEFSRMFLGSAFLGVLTAVVTALILKHLDLRRTPSLELGMMLVFSYIPYGLAEASQLSGIMALLFSGIVMSHYAHHNLSLVTQINLQHTLRTLAFLAETSVFAYIGMAMWSFEHDVQPSFCMGSIILILLARACNIYPLSFIVNKFRGSEVKINSRMQFVMWFSGLRGAIAYVLSLHLDVGDVQIRRIVITGTLGVVIFTIVVLGGSTYPLIKFLKITGPEQRSPVKSKKKKTEKNHVTLSKTEVLTKAIESDAYLRWWLFLDKCDKLFLLEKIRRITLRKKHPSLHAQSKPTPIQTRIPTLTANSP